ncbi:MAG TPA: phage protein GemA/Gp16 family protein [Pyrinomonadaceae bacterium]|nr:phage protein GemA/Gp16 family protein [Pyrinomonadaceae bacterium]
MSSNFCSTAKTARGDKTLAQVRRIFGLAKERDLNDDELRSIVEEETGQRHISALSRHDAQKVINRLGGSHRAPRRTVQHQRKQAGIVQLAQPAHLELLRDLARQRNMSEEGLARIAERMRLPYPPRTTADTNKLVEALKSMNRRGA